MRRDRSDGITIQAKPNHVIREALAVRKTRTPTSVQTGLYKHKRHNPHQRIYTPAMPEVRNQLQNS